MFERLGIGAGPGAARFLSHGLDAAGAEEIEIVNFVLEFLDFGFKKFTLVLQGAHKESKIRVAEIHKLFDIEHSRKLGGLTKVGQEFFEVIEIRIGVDIKTVG